MKLLTVAIPSYNSADYMGRAIESLLPAGDQIEILVIDLIIISAGYRLYANKTYGATRAP